MSKNRTMSFLILTILQFLVLLCVEFVPGLALVAHFALAGMLCSVSQKAGYKYSFASVVLTALFSYFVLKFNVGGVISVAIYSLIGVMVSVLIDKKTTKSTLLIVFGVAFVLIYAASFAYESVKAGENVLVLWINNFINEYINIINETPELFKDKTPVLEQYIKGVGDLIINLFPSLIIIISAVMAYVVLCFASLAMKISKCENKFVPLFSTFKIDGVTSVVYILSALMSFFLENNILLIVFMNIYTIIQFFLIVCGVSIFDFFLKSKRVNVVLRILLVLVLSALTSIPLVSAILTIVALVDARRDFRNLTGNRKYIGFVDGKPTILTQSQVEELLKKKEEENEKEESSESESVSDETASEDSENNNDMK